MNCPLCRDARWVSQQLTPFRGTGSGGQPCPVCNPGPEHEGWEPVPSERVTLIDRFFVNAMHTVAAHPAPTSITQWDPKADMLHAPFGYYRPVWQGHRCLFRYCPVLIAQQTEELSGDDLSLYLATIRAQVWFYIAHRELPDDEATEYFDRFAAETYGPGLALLSQVQMDWLDRQ